MGHSGVRSFPQLRPCVEAVKAGVTRAPCKGQWHQQAIHGQQHTQFTTAWDEEKPVWSFHFAVQRSQGCLLGEAPHEVYMGVSFKESALTPGSPGASSMISSSSLSQI